MLPLRCALKQQLSEAADFVSCRSTLVGTGPMDMDVAAEVAGWIQDLALSMLAAEVAAEPNCPYPSPAVAVEEERGGRLCGGGGSRDLGLEHVIIATCEAQRKLRKRDAHNVGVHLQLQDCTQVAQARRHCQALDAIEGILGDKRMFRDAPGELEIVKRVAE